MMLHCNTAKSALDLNHSRESKDCFTYELIFKLVVIYCILVRSNASSGSSVQIRIESPIVDTGSILIPVDNIVNYTGATIPLTSPLHLPGELGDNILHRLHLHLHRSHPRSQRTAYEKLSRNVQQGTSTICLQIASAQATAGDCRDNLGKSIPCPCINKSAIDLYSLNSPINSVWRCVILRVFFAVGLLYFFVCGYFASLYLPLQESSCRHCFTIHLWLPFRIQNGRFIQGCNAYKVDRDRVESVQIFGCVITL